jgi:predicted dithiol-disulfide oxidoreductase (DUF899 family)
MKYANAKQRLNDLRSQITAIRAEMRKTQQSIEPEEVADHVFQTPGGETRLSQLFGEKTHLFVVHNMGTACAYCTMWADGYNGIYNHLADRAAFVIASPDKPAQQRQFAESRGWRFPMVSDAGSAFASAMGYAKDGRPMPGISVFQREGARIVRVSDTSKGPYDDFCAAWHMFDMLPEGAAGWQPKFRYPAVTRAA